MSLYTGTEALYDEYEAKKNEIRRKLLEFRSVPAENYFYEMIFCLLTPQSSAAHALEVQRRLEDGDFRGTGFNPEFLLRDRRHYIRFHRVKSRHLLDFREKTGPFESVLRNETDPAPLREWLVRNISGVGYKEATHFLRNIGKNGELAILDRHILRNLQNHSVVERIPLSLTRKQYLAMEKKFQHFAESLGISLNELDLLFWSRETGMLLK